MSAVQQVLAAVKPVDTSVSLLLHGDGANGSQTIIDSSSNNFTITANGTAQISTSQKVFGSGSIFFNGTDHYLTVPQNSAFNFGTGDFTVECFVWRQSNPASYETLLGFDVSGGLLFQIYQNQLEYGISATAGIQSGTTVPANTFVHLAITRESGVVRLFQDGSLLLTYTGTYATQNFTHNTQAIVSGYSTSAGQLNGYVDELRVSKGIARYTTNFTVPSAPFPNP